MNKFKKIIASILASFSILYAGILPECRTVGAAIKGDLNGNNSVDIYDAIEIAKYLIGKRSLTASEKTIADFNGDTYVNLYDAIAIAKHLIKNNSPTTPYDKETMNKINKIVSLVNAERAKKGVKPVKLNYQLTEAAMLRAKEIETLFSHDRPNGTQCFTAIDEYKIKYLTAGENIAFGYPSSESVMDGWINSQGHYENIMNSSFSEIGVGIYGKYWVQFFIG